MSNKRTKVAWYALGSLVLCLALLVVACQHGTGTPLAHVRARVATGPLRVNPANPRYFTDSSGKAIYLTGAHTWSDMLDRGTLSPPKVAFDYAGYINWIVHHNFIRFWTAELPNSGSTDDPWENVVGPPWK